MRIAVLVYGRLNQASKCHEKIMESLGDEHTIDFFMSSDNPKEPFLTQFLDLYKPIAYTVEEAKYTIDWAKYPIIHGSANLDNMSRHFLNKLRVFQLLEKHLEKENIQPYDLILSLRVDLVIGSKFMFVQPDTNTIYIPSGYDFVEGGINDQVAYGNLQVMKEYMSLFSYMIEYLEKKISNPHPERLTLTNIRQKGIQVKRFQLNYYLQR